MEGESIGHVKLGCFVRSMAANTAVLVAITTLLILGQMARATENSPVHFQQQLVRVDRQLQAHIDLFEQRPGSWIHLEQVANSYLERARLTGKFEDYVASLEAVNQAFELSGDKAGPALTRAKLNFSIHRLSAVEADLLRVESALLVDQSARETALGLRADIWLYTADYPKAKEAYRQLEATFPSVSSASRLGHYYALLADYTEADRWFETAEQRVSGRSHHLRSWLKLQMGILDLERGRLEDALAHYQAGLALFPGFWLVEEHIAEIDALQGRDTRAEAKYRDLIKRTGSPLFMDALADILASRSTTANQNESVKWRAQSDDIYETRWRLIPELVSGHALEHFLQNGDRKRALLLAQENYQLRPGSYAALQLAQAHTTLGHLVKAAELLESLFASPYRSAELHATAGVVYRSQGDVLRADIEDSLAHAINRRAVKEIEWLLGKLQSAEHDKLAL